MSRIGKAPVAIPSGVTVSVGDAIVVKGPNGQLTQAIVDHVAVQVANNEVVVTRANNSKPARGNHGLMRALVQNMVTGVSKGFTKTLEVRGTGYRAEMRGKNLVLNLGYSHPIDYPVPEGIEVAVDKANNITVSGFDKQLVGQVAANIRKYREPDHYKGKGVRYKDEYVRIKAGKTA